MKTIVRSGLMGGFRPVLGQDDGGFYTWENQGDWGNEGLPGSVSSWDQINDGTDSGGYPGMISSWDQIVPPAERPPGMSDKDWAEIITAGLKAGAAGYGAYAGVEAERLKREAALAKAKPGILPDLTLPSGAVNPNAMFLIGGVVLVGVLAVIGLK